ncbi:MAG: hypothetical protein ACYDDS_09210 [Candidatus Sulfotelmatobacter sp.]
MEFMCSKCGRTEFVVGDQSPLCWGCGAPLIKAIQSYAGWMMSPDFVLHRMKKVVEKHGYSDVASGRFKREREACSTALYALALSEINREKYWIEVETVQQTPDTILYQIDQTEGHNTLRRQMVEVVDWEEHVDDVMELIRAKCRKQYPADFCLLIAARSGKMVWPQVIARDIRKLTVPFAEIWILGQSVSNTINVARLYPTVFQLEFNLFEALKRAKTDADVISRQKRGSETEFKNLGQIYLAIP